MILGGVVTLARGKSGRIVLEIDPVLKRKLYFELEKKQTTLKDWFLKTAKLYISDNESSSITVIDSPTSSSFISEQNELIK
jgi:hypothetical protein